MTILSNSGEVIQGRTANTRRNDESKDVQNVIVERMARIVRDPRQDQHAREHEETQALAGTVAVGVLTRATDRVYKVGHVTAPGG